MNVLHCAFHVSRFAFHVSRLTFRVLNPERGASELRTQIYTMRDRPPAPSADGVRLILRRTLDASRTRIPRGRLAGPPGLAGPAGPPEEIVRVTVDRIHGQRTS